MFGLVIIVRKRSIIDERLERLIETLQFMLEHQAELKMLHAELFPGVRVTTDKFSIGEAAVGILPEEILGLLNYKEEEELL